MKKSKHAFFWVAIFTLFSSCQPNNSTTNTIDAPVEDTDSIQNSLEVPHEPEKTIELSSFSTLQSGMEDAVCQFGGNNQELKSSKYLFVSDGQSIAFVKINGNMVKFKFADNKSISEQHYIETYSSDDYKLILDMKNTGSSSEESWTYSGTMTVKGKNGETTSMEIIGECGT